MTKEWLWWLGEFGLAAVVAIVAGFVTKDVPISILYGLFVGTVFFVLREHRRVASQLNQGVSDIKDEALNLPTALRNREGIDPFLKHLIRSSRDETIRLAKEAETGVVALKPNPVSIISLECIKQARPGDKVVAMTYGGIWGSERGDMYRQANFDLIDKGVDITRIFVESTSATPEQKKQLREEMDRQKERIHVRFIKETRLPPEARIDCVVILNRYMFHGINVRAWIPRRPGTGGFQVDELKISADPDEVQKATEMAETVIKLSEEYK